MAKLTNEQREARRQKDNQIRERFHYKKPTDIHQGYFDNISFAMDQLVDEVLTIPDGQERAVALTQLGLARMCINAAIANTSAEDLWDYNL